MVQEAIMKCGYLLDLHGHNNLPLAPNQLADMSTVLAESPGDL